MPPGASGSCRYCCDGCPAGLDIPALISTYNEIRFSPAVNVAMRIEFMPEDKKPTACIGCGLCARNCPVNAIKMKGGNPAWVKKNCAMRLGCLHRCPRFSIQYDDKTRNHGQYLHP